MVSVFDICAPAVREHEEHEMLDSMLRAERVRTQTHTHAGGEQIP